MTSFLIAIGIFVPLVIAAIFLWRLFGDPLLRQAKKGDIDAQYQLAREYYDGTNRAQDRTAAAYWCDQAAHRDHSEAQAMLGWMFEKGAGGLPRDREQSIYWYKKAADAGHGEAQCILGRAYFHGKGIPQNYFEAYCWLNVARAGGSVTEKEIEIMHAIEDALDPGQVLRAQRESVERYEKIRG